MPEPPGPDHSQKDYKFRSWLEECFQTAKNETGPDHHQVRRYDAWYQHLTLAILAHAYLAVTAATAVLLEYWGWCLTRIGPGAWSVARISAAHAGVWLSHGPRGPGAAVSGRGSR